MAEGAGIFEMSDAEKVVAGVMTALLEPQAGALPTHYAAKRGREICAVRRHTLTISERGRHVRRLRKKAGQSVEADALEGETFDLILSGKLKLADHEKLGTE
jgi:hypothetical protein